MITYVQTYLQTTHSHMKENQNHMDVNHLWIHLKNSDSIKKNIPTKSIGNKTTLPWVTPQIKKANKQEKQIIQKEKLKQ